MISGQLGRAMRLSITEGALACAMGTLTGGIFLTGFAIALGASELQIGLMAAMPALANIWQLVGSYFIERTGKRKALCLGALTASRLLWLLILLFPLVAGWLSPQAMVWILVAVLAGANTLNSIGGVGWLSWIKELIPEGVRIGFLSRRHQVDTVLALSLSILGGVFIDWHSARQPSSFAGFVLVFAVAMLCGLAGLPLMAAIPESTDDAPRGAGRPLFAKLLAAPLKDGNFRRVLGFYVYWNLAVNMAAPFFAVYMLQRLHLPFWYVTVLCTLSSVSGFLANPFWTRLSEKFGHRPIVFLATLGDALYPLWWFFVTPQTAWLLIPIHGSGLFAAPLAVGSNNMVFKLSPERNASPYMAVFNAIVGPITALAAILGGWLAGACGDVEWLLGSLSLGGLHVLFGISLIGRLTSLLLLASVAEQRSEPIRHVVEVLRRVASYKVASLMRGTLGRAAPVEAALPRLTLARNVRAENDASAAPAVADSWAA